MSLAGITSLRVIRDRTVKLTFADGSRRVVDLTPLNTTEDEDPPRLLLGDPFVPESGSPRRPRDLGLT